MVNYVLQFYPVENFARKRLGHGSMVLHGPFLCMIRQISWILFARKEGRAFALVADSGWGKKGTIMRFVIQRVTNSKVTIDGEVRGRIGKGFMVLIGVSDGDTTEIADLWGRKREDEPGPEGCWRKSSYFTVYTIGRLQKEKQTTLGKSRCSGNGQGIVPIYHR